MSSFFVIVKNQSLVFCISLTLIYKLHQFINYIFICLLTLTKGR